jgi:hypothetical protein
MPSPEFARLATEVSASSTVMASAATLITGLAASLRDHAEDPAAINALADELDTNATALGAAVTANTPAEVAPAPVATPAPDATP